MLSLSFILLRFTEREQTAADRKNKEDRRLFAGLSHMPQNCVFDGRICLWQAGGVRKRLSQENIRKI